MSSHAIVLDKNYTIKTRGYESASSYDIIELQAGTYPLTERGSLLVAAVGAVTRETYHLNRVFGAVQADHKTDLNQPSLWHPTWYPHEVEDGKQLRLGHATGPGNEAIIVTVVPA